MGVILIHCKGFALYSGDATLIPDEQTILQVSTQLANFGFQESQIKKAVSFISQPSPLLGKFLETLPALEAAAEYLLLHVPECDLPSRFLPDVNSSNPFISSAHSGTSDVQKRWIEDKAVKEAGWPVHIVQEFTRDITVLSDWPLLMVKLGRRLTGTEDKVPDQELQPFALDEDELRSLGAELRGAGHYALPSLMAPLTLHIFFNASERYPRPYYAPMLITSNSVPPYVRLHILSCVLSALDCIPDSKEPEETFGLTLTRIMDEEWARLEDEGPPDISAVMARMLPERKKVDVPARVQPKKAEKEPRSVVRSSPNSLTSVPKQEAKVGQLYQRHKNYCFDNLLQTIPTLITLARRRLPAFQARADFIDTLSKNRTVVVVGETGMPAFTT